MHVTENMQIFFVKTIKVAEIEKIGCLYVKRVKLCRESCKILLFLYDRNRGDEGPGGEKVNKYMLKNSG